MRAVPTHDSHQPSLNILPPRRLRLRTFKPTLPHLPAHLSHSLANLLHAQDTSYDSIWNVTCICPYKTESSGSVFESRSGICDDAKPSTDCAAVGFGSTELTYTLTELEELVDAVEDADTTISTSECPCERVDDDYRR